MTGACWPFVAAKFSQFIYGRYPLDQRWRVDLTFVMLVIGLVWLMVPRIPGKLYGAIYAFVFFPSVAFSKGERSSDSLFFCSLRFFTFSPSLLSVFSIILAMSGWFSFTTRL